MKKIRAKLHKVSAQLLYKMTIRIQENQKAVIQECHEAAACRSEYVRRFFLIRLRPGISMFHSSWRSWIWVYRNLFWVYSFSGQNMIKDQTAMSDPFAFVIMESPPGAATPGGWLSISDACTPCPDSSLPTADWCLVYEAIFTVDPNSSPKSPWWWKTAGRRLKKLRSWQKTPKKHSVIAWLFTFLSPVGSLETYSLRVSNYTAVFKSIMSALWSQLLFYTNYFVCFFLLIFFWTHDIIFKHAYDKSVQKSI